MKKLIIEKSHCGECEKKLTPRNIDMSLYDEWDGKKFKYRHYFCKGCSKVIRELWWPLQKIKR